MLIHIIQSSNILKIEGKNNKINERKGIETMNTKEKKAVFVYNLENFDAVRGQLNDDRPNGLLEFSITKVQKNRQGNNVKPKDNIDNWARRVFKR